MINILESNHSVFGDALTSSANVSLNLKELKPAHTTIETVD